MVLSTDGRGASAQGLERCSLLPIITSDQNVSKHLIDRTVLHVYRKSEQLFLSVFIASYNKDSGGHLGSSEES